MNLIFFLKLSLAPCLVALASLAGRRWGLLIGGAIAGFPVVFGPIILFIALEQGNDFAAHSALRGLLAILPFGGFVLTMSWASLRFPVWVALFLGWAVYLGGSWVGMQFEPGLGLAAVCALFGIVAGRALLPVSHKKTPPPPISPWDIPVRMASTLALLLSVTALARPMGPEWSGAMAAFPVASSVLGGFARISDGPHGPARLYRGVLMGSLAFGGFSAVLHLTRPTWGLLQGYGAAVYALFSYKLGSCFWPRVGIKITGVQRRP